MPASVIVHHDPEGINKRIIHSVDGNLLDWLISEYGEHGFNTPTVIFNGDVVEENAINLDNYNDINLELNDHDIINIVHRPQGIEVLYAVIIAVVAAVVLTPDISPPPAPENPNFAKTNESPNNRLTGQTNIARPLARIPDIYGRMRVYPDLGAKTVTEYIQHVKFVTEYLVVGRGEFQIDNIKSGETLLSEISGSTFTTYAPNSIIPELLDVTDSNEVNGQEVTAPNDATNFDTNASNVIFTASSKKISGFQGGLAAFESLSEGDEFVVAGTTNNNGTYTFVSFAKSGGVNEPPDYIDFYSYSITVEESLTDETVNSSVSFSALGSPGSDLIGAFIVPGDTEEVWFDIVAPRGLANRQSGSTTTVTVQLDLILDEIDSQGNIINTETTTVYISDNTLDARFYTFKITPSNAGSRYQASVQRISNTVNDSSYYDQTKWARLGGAGKITSYNQGNITTILLTTQATDQATQSQERKFNAVVTRKLRTYTTSGGAIIPALSGTTRFADALLEHSTNSFIGNKPTTSIDLDGLYAIQEQLDNVSLYGSILGRFSYSFSSEKSSVKDEIITIANACRVFIKKIGDRLEFARDEERINRVTLFNNRNKKPKSEKKSIRLQKPNDFDGVELQWVWEDTGESFTVKLPDNGETNPKKIEAAGIRNFKQAWNRAKIEFNKLKLNRESIVFESTSEGLYAVTGDRVANADGTDIKAQSGEIKAINGLAVSTYTPIDFKGSANGTVILRDESGLVDSEITVTQIPGDEYGFILGSTPSITVRVRGELNYQVGTLYTFALTNETKIKDYVIQKNSPKNNGYVRLELTNYNPLVYAPDAEIPPDHETTLISVSADAVASGNIIESHTIKLAAVASETLAWSAAPTGTYSATNVAEFARMTFSANIDGTWSISGYGSSPDSGAGDYRPKVIGDDPDNYEIKITQSKTAGSGTVASVGGTVFGSFVAHTGTEGIRVIDSVSGITTVDITVEIREIATPANTTGVASFTFSVDGVPPI